MADRCVAEHAAYRDFTTRLTEATSHLRIDIFGRKRQRLSDVIHVVRTGCLRQQRTSPTDTVNLWDARARRPFGLWECHSCVWGGWNSTRPDITTNRERQELLVGVSRAALTCRRCR